MNRETQDKQTGSEKPGFAIEDKPESKEQAFSIAITHTVGNTPVYRVKQNKNS